MSELLVVDKESGAVCHLLLQERPPCLFGKPRWARGHLLVGLPFLHLDTAGMFVVVLSDGSVNLNLTLVGDR